MIHTGRREGQKLRAKAQTLLPVFLCYFFFLLIKKTHFRRAARDRAQLQSVLFGQVIGYLKGYLSTDAQSCLQRNWVFLS